MVQFENTMRVRANNQNDENRSFDISADVEYNRENEKMRIFSGNVRTTENENVASFSKADTLSINYYDLDRQGVVNEAINAFISEVEEKVKGINF